MAGLYLPSEYQGNNKTLPEQQLPREGLEKHYQLQDINRWSWNKLVLVIEHVTLGDGRVKSSGPIHQPPGSSSTICQWEGPQRRLQRPRKYVRAAQPDAGHSGPNP